MINKIVVEFTDMVEIEKNSYVANVVMTTVSDETENKRSGKLFIKPEEEIVEPQDDSELSIYLDAVMDTEPEIYDMMVSSLIESVSVFDDMEEGEPMIAEFDMKQAIDESETEALDGTEAEIPEEATKEDPEEPKKAEEEA